ncbi:MAG: hypothetical protein RLZZ262_490 [Bacteroidota bacterium]|jgi:hypothetical protein
MLTNNDILKKIRVALQLRDEDILRILDHVKFKATKPEVNALFRNEDHPNYKPCGDQFLRNFLNGLVIEMRGPMPENKAVDVKEKGNSHKAPPKELRPSNPVTRPAGFNKSAKGGSR